MRPARKLIVQVMALVLAATAAARGDDEVQQQLDQMNGRLERLEAELRATHDELDAAKRRAGAQQEVIERAGLDDEEASLSGIARFLEATEFTGWVATSYWWNINRPEDGTNLPPGPLFPFGVNNGRLNTSMPFRPDHNSFQVDQVWFGMHKPATVESRAGFGIDIVFGKTADILNSPAPFGGVGPPPSAISAVSSGNLSHVYQAYVEFLAPTPLVDVHFTAGKFQSHLGAEFVQIPYNYNASRGLLFQIAQSNSYVGAKAEVALGPVRLMVGVANDSRAGINVDFDDDKAVLWALGWDVSDTIDLSVNGVWGGDSLTGTPANAGRSADYLGIVDLVIRWDPSDRLGAWLNFDYAWSRNDGFSPGPDILGIAAASRYMVTDRTGIAVRGEYLFSSENFIDPNRTVILFNEDQDLWSLTGTLDHALTENLLVRAELRYDRISTTGGPDNIFFITSRSARPLFPRYSGEQLVVGAEAVYSF